MKKLVLLVVLSLAFFTQCNNISGIAKVLKIRSGDPFKNTITPSQDFTIDTHKDNVVQAKNGTLAIFPKGCFKTSKGKIVNGIVKVELTEALTLKDMLLSNLTTTSNGQPLITGGMLYFNATENGEQLAVNKEIPVHFDIPTKKRIADMMAYKGTRDSNGNMNWTDPKQLDNYLIPIDIKTIDFLPANFAVAVEMSMPYKNHKTTTPELIDSLYYMLSVFGGCELIKGAILDEYYEAYARAGKDFAKLRDKEKPVKKSVDSFVNRDNQVDGINHFGIDPAIIKIIKSEKYQNTFIATKEFEARLQLIFKCGVQRVLDLYMRNLDKNLYEIDSMAALDVKESEGIPGRHYYFKDHIIEEFKEFAKQRKTNVRDAGKYSELLKGFYDSKIKEVIDSLIKTKKELDQQEKVKSKASNELVDKYLKLLQEREKYRMETYGFEWTETGWINVDNGTEPKTWGPIPIVVNIKKGNELDQLYTYINYLSITSIYRLHSKDNVSFIGGDDQDKTALMPRDKPAVLISVGYKGNDRYLAVKKIITGTEIHQELLLTKVTSSQLDSILRSFEFGYSVENNIREDLQYLTEIYRQEKGKRYVLKEKEMYETLWGVAYPGFKLTLGVGHNKSRITPSN